MERKTHGGAPATGDFNTGDGGAFDVPMNPHMFRERLRELATRHLDSVRRVCKRYVQNPDDADDLAQEVLVKAARAWSAGHGAEPAPGWLYRLAINHCNDHLRRRRRQEALLGRYLAECAALMPGPECVGADEGLGSFEATGASGGLVRETGAAYGVLPGLLARGLCQQDRRIAHLRYVIGLKHDIIARVTGLTRPAVSKRLAGIREHAARLYRRRGYRPAQREPA